VPAGAKRAGKCLVARVGRQRVRGCGYEEHLNRGNQCYERREARIITRADIFVVHACAVGVQDHGVRHFAGVVQGVDFAVLDVTYVPPVVLAEDVEFGVDLAISVGEREHAERVGIAGARDPAGVNSEGLVSLLPCIPRNMLRPPTLSPWKVYSSCKMDVM